MSNASTDLPVWVRATICVVGSLSVPGLVIAAAVGATITPCLAGAVGYFAVRTACMAFPTHKDREPMRRIEHRRAV